MARNSFLSNFLTIVFTLFEGENIHLKVIKWPKAMLLFWREGRRGEERESPPNSPKVASGRGQEMGAP